MLGGGRKTPGLLQPTFQTSAGRQAGRQADRQTDVDCGNGERTQSGAALRAVVGAEVAGSGSGWEFSGAGVRGEAGGRRAPVVTGAAETAERDRRPSLRQTWTEGDARAGPPAAAGSWA